MKRKSIIASFALSLTLSQWALARGDSNPRLTDREPRLTAVKFIGTLRCKKQETITEHKEDHSCRLEFVNDENSEVWNVKDNPTLTTLHQKGNKEIKAHIEAMSSPRYLLGGSYIEIKKIETLPSEVTNIALKDEPISKQNHVCSLDTNLDKN